MKSTKKILLGIAIILFGVSGELTNIGDDLIFVCWGISLIGLIISICGYWFTDDDRGSIN